MSNLFRRQAVEHASRRLSGEVILASPLSVRVLSALLICVLAAGLGFAALASYSRKETVPGWVTPEGGLIRVSARTAGIVDAISVKEGDTLDAAAQLVTLKLSSDVVGGDSGQAIARDLAIEVRASDAQARASRAKLLAQRGEMVARQAVLRKELQEARDRVLILERRQALADSAMARGESLQAKGFLSRSELDRLRSTALSVSQDASLARAAALALERQIGDLIHELPSLDAEIAGLQAQATQGHAALSQRIIANQTQSGLVATSPIAAKVVAVPVERGQAVPAGATLAVLTPKDSQLIAELYVPSRASGFIRPGQEVRILYNAYPYQTFGAGHGVVTSISRTLLAPGEVNLPGLKTQESVFRVRVALARQSVEAYGHVIPLRPGMLLTADVIIDRRSLLQWLLDPIYAAGRRI